MDYSVQTISKSQLWHNPPEIRNDALIMKYSVCPGESQGKVGSQGVAENSGVRIQHGYGLSNEAAR